MAEINLYHGITPPPGVGEYEPWYDESTGLFMIGDKRVSGHSNPNLLIDPDFKVNQRGQSSYTGPGYGLDGWKAFGSESVVTASENAITFSGADGGCFSQDIERHADYKGKLVTASCRVIDIPDAESWKLVVYDGVKGVVKNIPEPGTVSATLHVPQNATLLRVYILRSGSGLKSISFDRIKLELGPVSTLALDGPADYGTELAKCQRYYLNYGAQIYLPGMSNATGAFFCAIVDLPTMMRISPTVLAGNGIQLDIGGTRISTTIAYTGILAGGNRQVTLKFTPTAAIPANHAGVILINSLALSAEL